MTNLLEVDSVILEFDSKRVLQNVYLKSETGKVTGLLGRNGAGKSCLMKIMFGELIPNDKSIRINGNALVTSDRSPKDLRYLPQKRFVPNSLTIKRVTYCRTRLRGRDWQQRSGNRHPGWQR